MRSEGDNYGEEATGNNAYIYRSDWSSGGVDDLKAAKEEVQRSSYNRTKAGR